MEIGIGLDTGGTYTDAVVYDLTANQILAEAKALTTHDDLMGGILKALDALPPELTQQTKFFSLSTTLATNACVENKASRAKLFFIGVDPEVVSKNRKKYGLPPESQIFFFQSEGTFSGEILKEPNWQKIQTVADSISLDDGIGIVELFAGRNNGILEKEAKERLLSKAAREVVCSCDLFDGLNALERGAGVYLNAGLLPEIRRFLSSIEKALSIRKIHAPIGVIRSDGSLMSEAFAKKRPVETLLSGPAASATGAAHLAGDKNCVVVDMGGTTTDIALIQNSRPKIADGIKIGEYQTCVPGLFIDTFALGGDSILHIADEKLVIQPRRAVPLCVAAKQYPQIISHLQELSENPRKHTRPLQDFFLLIKQPVKTQSYTEEELTLCQVLESGPLPIEKAAHISGTDLYNLKTDRLEREGIIIRCGMTPTDVMHIRGDFTAFGKAASLYGAQHMAYQLGLSVETFCNQVYEKIYQKLTVELVRVFLENDPSYREIEYPEAFVRRIAERSAGNTNLNLFSAEFHTDYTLVGIGAPTHVFLPEVAKRLGAKCVIPPHAAVANAVGAVISQIEVSCKIEIQPVTSVEGIGEYRIYGTDEMLSSETLDQAVALAKEHAERAVRQSAAERGLFGPLAVEIRADDHYGKLRDCSVYLSTTVTATAKSATDQP